MKGVRYIIGCLLLWLVACQQHEVVEPMEEPVELTFKLDLADDDSRGLEDGDYLDLVSVYIVDANKNIVASQENITVANNATEVEVTFGKSYNLKRGIHTLMAVANHRTLIFEKNSYTALMNNQVHATSTTDNISSKNTVQPLSLMKEIELHAGNNQIEGELVRTFARLRIEVKNNSGSFPLKINSLTFSDNFTQQQAYVFDDGTDRKYSFGTDDPKSNSSHAKTPFTAMELEAQESAVLFDAYLLESKVADGEKYTYTLDLEYEGVNTTQVSYYRTNETAIGNVSNLEVGAESYYLIYNTNSQRYLSAGNDVVETSTLDDVDNLGTHVVWQLIEIENGDSYYIKNVETGKFIQVPTEKSVSMGNNEVTYSLNQIETGNNWYKQYYIALQSNNTNVGVYQSGSWGNNTYNVQGYNNNSSAYYFRFYKVTKRETITGNQDITYDAPITLTTIDPITQQSSPTTAIKRNDFINVLVTVSYNPVAGKFEFKVEDWYEGGGNVEFN